MDDATTTDAATDNRLLLSERRDGIAILTLNRPRKYNALSVDLVTQLKDALDEIARDTSVRVAVIAGAGKAFSAGHDLGEMHGETPEAAEAEEKAFPLMADVVQAIAAMPQPVIARVQGVAAAAGCQLVAGCDLAVASSEARFATSGINVGLFCSTPMVAVSRNMPRKQALEMLLTGDFIDAGTALRYGLVNHVVPPEELDDAVDGLARRIASKSPTAIAMGKRLFYRQVEADMRTAYAEACETIGRNMEAPETREGIAAFVEKRPMPEWPDRDAGD